MKWGKVRIQCKNYSGGHKSKRLPFKKFHYIHDGILVQYQTLQHICPCQTQVHYTEHVLTWWIKRIRHKILPGESCCSWLEISTANSDREVSVAFPSMTRASVSSSSSSDKSSWPCRAIRKRCISSPSLSLSVFESSSDILNKIFSPISPQKFLRRCSFLQCVKTDRNN